MRSRTKERIYALLIAVCALSEFLIACAYDRGVIRFGTAVLAIIGGTAAWVFFFYLIRLEGKRRRRR